MATFWEIAARSVGNLFSLCFVCLWCLFVSRFGFKSGICLLIAPVPVRCFSITFIVLDGTNEWNMEVDLRKETCFPGCGLNDSTTKHRTVVLNVNELAVPWETMY